MENLKKYWDKGVSFEEYFEESKKQIEHPKTESDKEKKPYYILGIQRMERMLKTFHPSKEDLQKLENKNFTGKILVITEGWCGDASQCTPVLHEFFKDKNEVRFFYRDSDTNLINQFLTNGGQAIPKVLILNENFEVINTWGPRPQHGLELLTKFKNDPENYPREQFYHDLQIYYAKNKGKDTISEILDLL